MTNNTTNQNTTSNFPDSNIDTETIKRTQNYRAPVDVYETEGAFRVIADMPGTSSEKIAISVEDNMLTIDAEVLDRYAAFGKLRHQEYGVGDFHRSFRIGDGIDADCITASYRDGVLELTLPKSLALKPRKIDIKAA